MNKYLYNITVEDLTLEESIGEPQFQTMQWTTKNIELERLLQSSAKCTIDGIAKNLALCITKQGKQSLGN